MSIKLKHSWKEEKERGGDILILLRCMEPKVYRTRLLPKLTKDGQEELNAFLKAESPGYSQDAFNVFHRKDMETLIRFARWANKFNWEWSLMRKGRKK